MFRAFFALLLSLVLAFTSHSVGMAKATPMAVGQMVICTGIGATVVHSDAEGQPTTAPHLCPDCLVHLEGAVLPPQNGVPLALDTHPVAARTCSDVSATARPMVTPPVRGPPGMI